MFGRSSLAEELATITLRALLVSALVFSSLYSEIIGSAATKMANAGRQLSPQIMNAMGAPGSSAEPIDYWCDWINGKDNGGKPRFGYDYISTKIINAKSMVQEAQQALSRVGSSKDQTTAATDRVQTDSSVSGTMVKVLGFLFGGAMIAVAIAFAWLTAGLTGAMAAIGCIVLAAFSFLGGYIGTQMLYYLIYALGIAVMPLCVFDRFKDLWLHWIFYLIGTLLAVFLFYVFNAFGFGLISLITTHIFESGLLSTILGQAASSVLTSMFPVISEAFQKLGLGNGQDILLAMFPVAIWLGGIAIVSALVAGGLTLGGVGIAVGLSWQRAFTHEGVLETITRLFQGLQGGVSTMMGALANRTVQAGAEMGRGAFSLFRGAGKLFLKK